jgi:hypothetical protein
MYVVVVMWEANKDMERVVLMEEKGHASYVG